MKLAAPAIVKGVPEVGPRQRDRATQLSRDLPSTAPPVAVLACLPSYRRPPVTMQTKQLARWVRSLTPPRLRRSVARVGRFLTADLSGVDFPSIELALGTLRNLGFAPGFCVDVGAYRGEWTRMLKTLYPKTRVLMIEPQESKRPLLEAVAIEFRGEVEYRRTLLGAQDGQIVPFHEMETGSSVLGENNPYPRVTVQQTLRTLDSILS